MSIAKRNLIDNINRIIPDEILREQMIDLHLGKLSDKEIERIRLEREEEAIELLKLMKEETLTSQSITNGESEKGNNGNNRDENALSIN
jgi:hypothetical protein